MPITRDRPRLADASGSIRVHRPADMHRPADVHRPSDLHRPADLDRLPPTVQPIPAVLPADLPLPLGAAGLLALAAVLPGGLIDAAALHHDDLVAAHVVPYLFAYPGEAPQSAWTQCRRGYAQSRAPFVAALADGLGPGALAGLRREALVQARAALSDVVPAGGLQSAAELLTGALRHLEASVDAEEIGCALLTPGALPPLRRAACDAELALIALVTHATLLRCPVADRRLELLIAEVHTSARDLHALHLGVRPWCERAVMGEL